MQLLELEEAINIRAHGLGIGQIALAEFECGIFRFLVDIRTPDPSGCRTAVAILGYFEPAGDRYSCDIATAW